MTWSVVTYWSYANLQAEDEEVSVEAEIEGDIKDLYEYSLPDDMGDDFAQDVSQVFDFPSTYKCFLLHL